MEQVACKPGVANGPVLALDVGVLLRISCLDVMQCNAFLFGPRVQRSTDVFRAVIAAYRNWLAASFDDLLQASDHTRRRQGDIDLHRQSLPVEIVQHIQKPEASPICELMVHEIHRPGLVSCLGHRQWLRRLSDDALARLDADLSSSARLAAGSISAPGTRCSKKPRRCRGFLLVTVRSLASLRTTPRRMRRPPPELPRQPIPRIIHHGEGRRNHDQAQQRGGDQSADHGDRHRRTEA